MLTPPRSEINETAVGAGALPHLTNFAARSTVSLTTKNPKQIALETIDAAYGIDTPWEEPNEFGEEGFTRAQAESDIDADDISRLIERAINADRAQWFDTVSSASVQHFIETGRYLLLTPAPSRDPREVAHIECDCVPGLGPSHCHLCGERAGTEAPWTEAHPAPAPVTRESVTEVVMSHTPYLYETRDQLHCPCGALVGTKDGVIITTDPYGHLIDALVARFTITEKETGR